MVDRQEDPDVMLFSPEWFGERPDPWAVMLALAFVSLGITYGSLVVGAAGLGVLAGCMCIAWSFLAVAYAPR